MVSSETALLYKLFPEALYHTKGLKCGQYEIPGYYLNFAVGFYTCSITHNTTFVRGDWEKVLHEFKENTVGSAIVKGNGIERASRDSITTRFTSWLAALRLRWYIGPRKHEGVVERHRHFLLIF